MPLFQAVLIIVMQSLLASQKKKTERLQLIQSSAAWLLTRTKRREHISPVLAALHWLSVTFRIVFKVLLLIYKALNELRPSYIANSLVKYLPSRTLRSYNAGLLEVPSNSRKENRGRNLCHLRPKAIEHTAFRYQQSKLAKHFFKKS